MFKQIITQHKILVGTIMALLLVALIPLFVKSPYYLDLFIMVLVYSVLAMAFIVMFRTGLINLSLAAFWGMGAYASAILMTKLHLSFWLSLPAAACIAGIIAVGIGWFLIGKGISELAFIIRSAVIGMLFTVVVGNIPFLGGYNGISNIPVPNPIKIPFLPQIEFVSKVQYFYLILFLFVIVILVLNAFYLSWTGRAWKAIGLNSQLAESIGVSIFKYKMTAFVVSSVVAAVVGAFYAHYQRYVVPDSFGMWINIDLQIYAILGGLSYSIMGPVLGSAIMTILPEYLRVFRELAYFFTGTLLILLIMFLPQGLLGLLDSRAAIAGSLSKAGKKLLSLVSGKHQAN